MLANREANVVTEYPRHVVQLVSTGYAQVAADVLLRKELRGELQGIVSGVIRRLELLFSQNLSAREACYQALIEIAFNMFGMEAERVGFSEKEKHATIQNLTSALKGLESVERQTGDPVVALRVIGGFLDDMKRVMMGKSMLARIAQEIEKEIRQDDLMQTFILASFRLFKNNVYYMIVTHGMSKLGNDSATGLRELRHIGAVQVSMNPVIAARAYNERPGLWDRFMEAAKARPDLCHHPEEHGDELALTATVTAFLPNLLTFRPIALLSNMHDGLVSYQLNPHYGTNIEASVADATKIYAMLGEELQKYDSQLLWNPEGKRRPNIVFKVPACSPEAIEITSRLNALGIGTNNTVTFTVPQEATLIMAAMRGLSEALKMRIPIGQVYETNMIGRLEDHLREAEAERLLRQSLESENGEERLQTLLKELGAIEAENVSSQEQAITIASSKKYLRNLADKKFVKALSRPTRLGEHRALSITTRGRHTTRWNFRN